jgi:UDP:flavonoid glycosyltransferase YjiC (YdhE family)
MRIGIQAWGSEGDIRPCLALGAALSRAGHDVSAVVTDLGGREYEGYATELGIQIRTVARPSANRHEQLDRLSERLIRLSPFAQGKLITRELFAPAVPEMFQAARELCAEFDLVIGHYYQHPLRTAAEASDVPAVTVTISPNIIVSRSYPPTGVPALGPRWNQIWWHVAYRLVNRAFLPDVNKLRVEAGLPAIHTMREVWHSRLLDLVAVSPALFPAETDWDPRHKVCGFFEWPMSPQDRHLPEAVEEFLCAGDPPVFFGFGSLSPNQPLARRQLLNLFSEAVERLGCRAIFQGLAPGMETTGHILHVGRANHARLFPRCKVIVHHGGAGTTHSAIRAGVPSVIVPHVSDQSAWGAILHRRGVASKPIRRAKLSVRALVERVHRATDSEMRKRSENLAGQMAHENGACKAAAFVNALLK